MYKILYGECYEKKCICTNENSFREQRRKFLSSMIMAGVVYSAPALLTINEAQAGSYPSRSSRRSYYSRRSNPSYRYHHHRRHYSSRPSRFRLNISIHSHPSYSRIRPRFSAPSHISVKISS